MSTYTTVHKDYPAETFEAAAAAMLRDPEVWRYRRVEEALVETGDQMGYSVESWVWNAEVGVLRVNFR